ncbi:cytochrome P450 [Phascolomyces articulosus]|uniref:Cytochrome P450 n=1 Tax=Phascolomyces articulosus TaxID=60185 RepID=A0AAD5KAU9_9FUNG|nr:cytochrome P450 [Phascolomyces articulosus]
MGLLQQDSTVSKIVFNTPGGATTITLGVAAGIWLLLSSLKHISNPKIDLKTIPSPKGAYPYFGHLPLLGEIPSLQFSKWHKELGPLISVKMGVKQWISISDANLAHQILGIDTTVTANRPHTTFLCDYHALKDNGIAGANPSTQWKKTRAATLQILSPRNREHLDKLHGPDADLLIETLVNTTARDGSVAVSDPLHFTSLNVIFATCFGRRAESVDDPVFKEVSYLMNQTGKRSSPAEEISTFLPVMAIMDILFRKKKDMHKFIYERRNPAFERYIKASLEEDVDCFAKSLLEMEDINNHDNVIVTLADLIIAGTDTTAVMLEWSMIILCHYPEVQKTMREEIGKFVSEHGRLPTFDERESVPYSISVQKECMRFRPITYFGLPHEASQDIEVNGYLIPKGASIVCDMRALHRDPALFLDPDTFIPDRYVNERSKPMYTSANMGPEMRDHYNFGFGRRVCPGAYLAELEIFNVWVRLYSRCLVEPAKDAFGLPVYPDLDDIYNAGITSKPGSSTLRIIKYKDALL